MSITKQYIEYTHEGIVYEAYVAHNNSDTPKPCVMICHAWAGRDAHEEEVADKLAALGYVGFAADVYGKGVHGNTPTECTALMTPLKTDRPKLQARLLSALSTASALPFVNAAKVVVSGYCFGGLCALDMARINASVCGVAAFHALLDAPGNTNENQIKAKVIAFHGWDDPMATPENVNEFSQEMSAAKADWQLHAYGNTLHAFTNKQAADPSFGAAYQPEADRRSWASFADFLTEVFI